MPSSGASLSPILQLVQQLKEEIRERLRQLNDIETTLRESQNAESLAVQDALVSLFQDFPEQIRAPLMPLERLDQNDFLSASGLDASNRSAFARDSLSPIPSSLRPSSSYTPYPEPSSNETRWTSQTPRSIPTMPLSSEVIEGALGIGLPPGAVYPGAPQSVVPGMPSSMNVDIGFVNQLSNEQLDGLPYGVIQLDARGRVVGYNDTESRMVGLPKERVIGRNFFQEVAPCTRVQEFEGRFRDLAEGRSRKVFEQFEFVFNFRKGAQRVVIMIFRARQRGIFNISIIRR